MPRNYPVLKYLCRRKTINKTVIKERKMSSTRIKTLSVNFTYSLLEMLQKTYYFTLCYSHANIFLHWFHMFVKSGKSSKCDFLKLLRHCLKAIS